MKRIKWGILGCANIARKSFLPAVAASANGTAVAIASRDGAKAAAWAQEHQIDRSYDSYERLLADPEVDAVYIPLPNSLHAEWIERAAAAGKHVFCEKPLTANAAEAVQAVAAAARHGVLLFEAFVYRLHPQTALVRRLLDEGAIGEVKTAHAWFHFHLQERVHNVRMKADLAGGALMDVGCYCIDWARWLLGEPESVWASAQYEAGVDTTCQGALRFAEGRSVTFSASMDCTGYQGARIFGTKGEIELTAPWHPRGEQAAVIVRTPDGETVHRVSQDEPPFTAAVNAFGDAVLAGRPLPVAPDEGTRNMRAIDAARASLQTGTWAPVE